MTYARCKFCHALRRWLFEPMCGPFIWCSDISLENDRLREEVERLREQLRGAA